MTWVRRTLWRDDDGSLRTAEGADPLHAVHDAITYAADHGHPVEVEYEGVTVRAAGDDSAADLLAVWRATATDKRRALEGKTFDELYEMAQDRDIAGRSHMSKAELVDALS